MKKRPALVGVLVAAMVAVLLSLASAAAYGSDFGAICTTSGTGHSFCGTATPLDIRDWNGSESYCHKNNLASPDFYDPDADHNITDQMNSWGTTWWVVEPGGNAGSGTSCPSGGTVIAKTLVIASIDVGSDDGPGLPFPGCDSGFRNPCDGRTAFFVEVSPVSKSVGMNIDTTHNLLP